ncbi:MAG TPA: 30S ribosomal protein S4e [Methanothrix sp.]|nr:30S ribosomal protein S4e [Methanothrix sp.]HRW83329.1 30S ribosomal protein S4e [Methanothrix sp.]
MSRHQKRIASPRSWPIARKIHTWVAKSKPGPHSAKGSIPLVVVVRDLLGLVDNSREAKRILHEGGVLVDGKARKDVNFPVGIFDVISVPAMDTNYRLLSDAKGRFNLHELEAGEARKLCRIENKTILKGGKLQLNLNDGTNILAEGDYGTGSSVILSIPDKEIADVIEFKEGNLAMVVGGSHSGEVGTIKEIEVVKSSRPNKVIISGKVDFETTVDHVFMIGRDKPAIKLGAEI